jgi:hypothetical protein
MKALKTALVVLVTGVALSFASQAKATTDCHPIMLSSWSTNKPYPSGMAPLFDEKCNFVKYIPVSGNVSFVAPMPNAVTTTIPVTTTTIQANAFSITDVYVEQVKEDVYFNVYLSGQETSSETFKLFFTSGNPQYSTWKSEKSFENQWLKEGKEGFRFSASHMISKTDFGNYSFNVQAVTTSGITSNPYSFSFNYSKPTWKQAGCDDLTELNKEWRDTWAFTDKFWQASADREIDKQNNPKWNALYGEPKNRQFIGYGCNNKLNWEIVNVKAKQFIWMYTLCADGWQSGSRGRGTCSWHGGVSDERGYYKTVSAKRIQFYWVH